MIGGGVEVMNSRPNEGIEMEMLLYQLVMIGIFSMWSLAAVNNHPLSSLLIQGIVLLSKTPNRTTLSCRGTEQPVILLIYPISVQKCCKMSPVVHSWSVFSFNNSHCHELRHPLV